ncbi:HEPN/Toprim-associated domain-containing protein [Streptomyces sp. NPDC057694]|uniref:HEPN/Toprim-associated domain-containing protein n=1 Tax=Streptomyces sp. NPDC057694 TaxID=3346216 RepID=UPI00368007DE
MGDNWTLLLDGRQIRFGKNETPAKLMTVFREEDKYQHLEWARRVDEVNARGEATWDELDEFEGFNHRELFGYRTTVQTIMTRLKLMGFDPDRCRQEMIKDLEGFNEDDIEDGLLVLSRPTRERKQAVYHRVSAAEVLDMGIAAYLKRAEAFENWKRGDDRPKLAELQEICVSKLDFFFDDLAVDPRLFLVLILSSQDPKEVLQLDMSELLMAGYFDSSEAVSTEALQQLRDETASSGPIIVITEGKYDSRVLGRALRIVRPDIAGYFAFWNLEETKAAGGTDRVVANLRSFAAAGVMNRVIALVDNDAAGQAALKTLASPALPKNYIARNLPDLDYARLSNPRAFGPKPGRRQRPSLLRRVLLRPGLPHRP